VPAFSSDVLSLELSAVEDLGDRAGVADPRALDSRVLEGAQEVRGGNRDPWKAIMPVAARR